MGASCRMDCSFCPAAQRCGRKPNFCRLGRCDDCASDPLLNLEVRRAAVVSLGGPDLAWPRRVRHHRPARLPLHLPVLVQAYADTVEIPWVALHGGRLLGTTGRLTPKHRRRPLREVYRLGAETRVALELHVEDRVLEGVWARRRQLMAELIELDLDPRPGAHFSVWRDAPRFEQILQTRRASVWYHEATEAGLPVLPDIGWSLWEPDGRLWAEWVNSQPELCAVSIFCGGKRIHAESRAHRETVEDIARFHEEVRPEVAFVLGGLHSPRRLLDYRQATPGRRLAICNGQAYALAQRRRLLSGEEVPGGPSTRDCFLRNLGWVQEAYAGVLGSTLDAV